MNQTIYPIGIQDFEKIRKNGYLYIKLNGTAEEALRQIEERQYALPFASDPRQVFKIGVNFSSVIRNIERWLLE